NIQKLFRQALAAGGPKSGASPSSHYDSEHPLSPDQNNYHSDVDSYFNSLADEEARKSPVIERDEDFAASDSLFEILACVV
ncbi:MAG TPA: hypothetical protein VFQ43_21145, partial [Nitrososphaera sp.]|nr:hypothetical protein [Nitrososphaera sp.]